MRGALQLADPSHQVDLPRNWHATMTADQVAFTFGIRIAPTDR